MKRILFAALFLLPASAHAELTIEQLIEQSGLREGPTASRDFPGWTPPTKILVPASYVEQLSPVFPGIEFIGADWNTAAELAGDVDAVFAFCSENVVANARKAHWIQLFSSGAERCLALPRVGSGDFLLSNMQKMTSPAIGEHAIAMTLALGRTLVQFSKDMPSGEWDRSNGRPNQMLSVHGKTMLVVGLGGIGREVAVRAHGLGMTVLATRNSSRDGPDYVDYVGLSDELVDLAAKADVIVNALPLTPKTTGLFDKAFFDEAKPGHIFVNVARGASVVTDDLVAALEDGRVSAAGLDVTDPEPLPSDHVLWQMDNVIITPHVAWAGYDPERQRLLVIENIRRYIAGDALLNVVDPSRGY